MIVSEEICPEEPTIIVTGANGWLGKALIKALVNGIDGVPECRLPSKRIRALVLPGEDVSQLESISGDLEIVRGDIQRMEDCSSLMAGAADGVLFHTAGIIHPQRVHQFYDINVAGTLNILSSAIQAGVRRAVVVSSNSPIGCNPVIGHLFDETSPFDPYMHYGRSKMLMEREVMRVQNEGRLETVRIRAPWFYGPFQPARQTLFFQMIRDGKAPIVGSGHNLRSMAYIDNLAQGLMLAANSTVANGNVYWIADRRPYSMNEIVDTIETVLENDFHIECTKKRMRLPSFLSDVAWGVDKLSQQLGFYNQKVHVLSEMNKNIACSVDAAIKDLNYKPTVDLSEGMKRSIGWILDVYGKI